MGIFGALLSLCGDTSIFLSSSGSPILLILQTNCLVFNLADQLIVSTLILEMGTAHLGLAVFIR